MKVFYTGSDMEELAASGVTRLELAPGASMTDVARETAEVLGIEIVRPGQRPSGSAPAPSPSAPAAAPSAASPGTPVSARPRGCQHGPLGVTPSNGTAKHAEAARPAADGVVGKLANVISRMAGQGG
jgi:hypothetical protein